MSEIDRALADDVRALLAAFESSGARTFSMSLRDGVDLAIQRDKTLARGGRVIVASHVATVLKLPETRTAGGEITLELLGEEISVPLDEAEIVEELLVIVGDLVEFGSPLVRLQEPD